ncbi:MAG: hypothetical protein O7G88_13720 [bacterium]|nr:hypothetical protein [bacterium]
MTLVCSQCQYRSKQIKLAECPKCGEELEAENNFQPVQRPLKVHRYMEPRKQKKRQRRQPYLDLL